MNTYYVVTAEHGTLLAVESDVSRAAASIIRSVPAVEILAVACASHVDLIVNALEGYGPEDDDWSEYL